MPTKLITFQTDAYESITYFGHIALRLLTLIDQTGRVPGAILAADVPHALALLRKAVEGEHKNLKPSSSTENEDDAEPEIGLAHRALPLIALFEAAAAKHCDVMWNE